MVIGKLSDLPWDRFDAAKVDPDLLAVAKAASAGRSTTLAITRVIFPTVFTGDDAELQLRDAC